MTTKTHSGDFKAFCRLPDGRTFFFRSASSVETASWLSAFDFFLDANQKWRVASELIDTLKLTEIFRPLSGDQNLSSPLHPRKLAAFPDFENFFSFAQSLIAEGQVRKLVPFVFDHYESVLCEAEIFNIVQAQLALSLEHLVFGLVSAELKIFSLTPEFLFWRRGRRVRTMALAGTARLGGTYSDHQFANDPKEVEEHELVVQDLLERIKPFEIKKIQTAPRKIKKLKTLAHLCTEIEFEIGESVTDEVLVKTLHPTAAMLGYPRAASLEIMKKRHDQSQRGFFGAPILFPLGNDEVFCAINIRSVIEEHAALRVGSGCGLVPQSQLQREWDELSAKRASVLAGLHLQ